jgi:septal ring factor EnvC (AmiA/AmiB activator)
MTLGGIRWWAARVAASACLLAAFGAAASNRSRLAELKAEINRHTADLRRAEGEVSTSLEAVHELDQRLENIDKTLVDITAEVTETTGRLVTVQADLTQTEAELAARQGRLRRHARTVYKLGRYPMVTLLVGADEMGGFIRRVRFVLALTREDRRLVRAVARKRDEVRADRDAVQEELSYLTELEHLKVREMALARGRRTRKSAVLAAARSRRDVLTKRLRDLKAEKAELEALVVAKGSTSGTKRGRPGPRAGGRADLLSRHGKLSAPAAGAVVRGFGLIRDDRYDTVTKNDGVDIEAPLGAEVKAVMKGKVIFADWFRGYGKLLIVDHGDGYTTVYAHLGTFAAAAGDAVREGQLLGTVGDTGYVANPTLHFEIRRDGAAVNPEPWLK